MLAIFIFLLVAMVVVMVGSLFGIFDPKGYYSFSRFNSDTFNDRKKFMGWLGEHPSEEAIFNKLTFINVSNGKEVQGLIDLGAKVVIVPSKNFSNTIVITDKMLLVTDGDICELFAAPRKDLFIKRIRVEKAKDVNAVTFNAPAHQKSVIKSAVAGGVLAGGVGAVVGAVAAANHNNNAKPTRQTIFISNYNGQEEVFYHFTDVKRMRLDDQWKDGSYKIYIADGVTLNDDRIDLALARFLDTIWK